MKNALIIHAWYDNQNSHWYPWLKNELQNKGYHVDVPDIPELRKDVPDMKRVLTLIENNIVVNSNATIVGHSIGSLIAMRLGEKHAYHKMILVAGWDFNDLTEGHRKFWETPIDHEAIRKNVANIYVVHSDNDPYITAIQAKDMSKRLNGKFILVEGAGHFTAKEGVSKIPKLLEIV